MQLFELENNFLKLTLSSYGASWLSCQIKPLNNREILVTTTPERWQQNSAFFGATIGRYANRIANAQYRLNAKTFTLAKNNGGHSLHGGLKGADKVEWQVMAQSSQAVKFAYIFANGEEGFGGEVKATVEYHLNESQVEILFNAISDADTPLCLTNHAYFNLSGEPTVKNHQLQINACHYLPVSSDGIPNAPLKAVAGTSFDFRQPKTIRQDLLVDSDQQAVKGYDHAFLIAKNSENPTACLAVADLRMELETTYPAIQLYTGNWLGGQPNLNGGEYQDYAGLALEPEFFPNSPNQPELAEFGGITRAGEQYRQQIIYKFIIT